MHTYRSLISATAYFAPIQFYTKFLRYDEIYIEQFENYTKQSYRNRCKIYGANGLQQLSIPVIKQTPKTLTKDIEISYEIDWQNNHLRSIDAAYRSSPFYEYLIDEFIHLYKNQTKFLLDFNNQAHEIVCELLQISNNINLSLDYYPSEFYNENKISDFREVLHPKTNKNKEDKEFKSVKYQQVFQEKYGFIENLSIIDLLFNEGGNAHNILKNSLVL